MQPQASPVLNPPSPCAASSSSPTPSSTSSSLPKYPRLTRSSPLQRHPAINLPPRRPLEQCEETRLSPVSRRCTRRSGRCCLRRGSVFSSPCHFSFIRVSRQLGGLLGRDWISWRIGWFLRMGLWKWCFGFGWVELPPFLGRGVELLTVPDRFTLPFVKSDRKCCLDLWSTTNRLDIHRRNVHVRLRAYKMYEVFAEYRVYLPTAWFPENKNWKITRYYYCEYIVCYALH